MTLKIRVTMSFFLILVLTGIVMSPHAFAQTEKLQAAVFLVDIRDPIVIPDFSINGEYFYDAIREGKPVKLPFRDLKEIRFLNPGRTLETEVLFHDGRREPYSLRPASDIRIDDGGFVSEYHHTKVARIVFSPMPSQPPPPNKQPALPLQPGFQPGTSDRVILKGGDSLSGTVQTKTFSVRATYGTIQLATPKIAAIEFDAKEPSSAVVLLKNGDRLSGTVEVDSLMFVMASGQEIKFDGKTIKAIYFKR